MKNIKNIAAFVAGDKPGRAINGVYIAPDKIVATDSYKLIEIKTDTGVVAPVIVQLPPKVKTFEALSIDPAGAATLLNKGAIYNTGTISEEFPKYEDLVPVEDPALDIMISAKHLREVCAAFEGDALGKMLFRFYGKNKVIVITNESGDMRSLLMPMHT